MIAKLKTNRVYRTYTGGSRIDALVEGRKTEDGRFPEDWLASTVRAFNPGREDIVEGLGQTEDGTPICDLAPQGLPILVKLLDAAQRLVIQAHPTRAFAWEAWHSKVGKTECWYILEADADACVYIGFQAGITKEKWVEICEKQDVPAMLACLHRFPVKKGDCVFVPGGVPHAIGGGCLMLETQEPSDLMVVPERYTPSGVKLDERKLHGGLGFERMYDCFCYDGADEETSRRRFFRQPQALDAHFSRYVDSAENGIFSVVVCETKETARHTFREPFAISVVTEGAGEITLDGETKPIRRGDRLLLLGLQDQALTLTPGTEGLSMVFALPAPEKT